MGRHRTRSKKHVGSGHQVRDLSSTAPTQAVDDMPMDWGSPAMLDSLATNLSLCNESHEKPFIDEAVCSRTLEQYNIDWQEVVTGPRIEKRTEAIRRRQDSRRAMPQSRSDVDALQTAMAAAVDDFTHLVKREPVMPSPWLSYNEQIDDLSQQLARKRTLKGRREDFQLPRLAAWTGGIDSDKILKRIRERVPARHAFPTLDHVFRKGTSHVIRNPACLDGRDWERDIARLTARMCSKLHEERIVLPHYTGDASVDNVQEAYLNTLVARETEPYRTWLVTRGLKYFLNEEDWGEEGPEVWDFWCSFMAPSVFVATVLNGRPSKRESLIIKKNHRAAEVVQRPVITLAEAVRGRKAWKWSERGEGVSDEGMAYLHALLFRNPMLVDTKEGYSCSDIDTSGEEPDTNTANPTDKEKEKRKRRTKDNILPVKRVHFDGFETGEDDNLIIPAWPANNRMADSCSESSSDETVRGTDSL